jgi:hypothetical protein
MTNVSPSCRIARPSLLRAALSCRLDAPADMAGFKNCASLGFHRQPTQAKTDETSGTRRQSRQAAMKRTRQAALKTFGCGSAMLVTRQDVRFW